MREIKVDTGEAIKPDANECPKCLGIWFGVNTFEKSTEVRWAPDNIPSEQPAPQLKGAACPDCAGPLIGINLPTNPRMSVQGCTVCHGRWVENAEFAKVRPRSVWKKFLLWLNS